MNGTPDDWQRLLGERAWLGSLARQLVRSDEVADEAAHEALAAAWVSKVPAGLSPRRWLAAILGKQLAGRRRAQHRRTARELQVTAPDPAPPAADVVARFEVQRAVADAVLALPEPYRTTVLRRFFEDELPATIAAAMAVPVETVRTRLKRGIAMLRERLDAAHRCDRRAWALPLWLAARRVDSLAIGLLLGVSLMTSLQKLVAAGIAAGLAVLLWVALPDNAPVQRVAASRDGEPVLRASGGDAAAAAPVLANERAEVVVAGAVERAVEPFLVVTGTVVDDANDAPLAGIPLRLVTWPRDEASECTAVSDVHGRFTLQEAEEPSRFREVLVLSPEYALLRARISLAKAGPDEVGQRGDAGTLRLVRGTWLSGQVVDAWGRGVAGAQLLLPLERAYFGNPHPELMLHRFATVGRSDSTGAFRLAHAIGPDVDHANLLFAVAPSGIGWHRFAPTKQRSDVPDVVVRQRPSGALRVVVHDPSGATRAGVLVRALPRFSPLGFERIPMRAEVSEFEPVRAFFRGTTDGNGAVRFPALPLRESDLLREVGVVDGAYDLWLEADGFPMQPLLRCEVLLGTEVEVPAWLVAARQVAVTVFVRDDVGAPVPHAAVHVHDEKRKRGEARTDGAGRAELAIDVVPSMWVVASADGHGQVEQRLVVGETTAPVTATLVLPRVRPLEGVVVDQDGRPAAGMWLVFKAQQSVPQTDAAGRFRIEDFPVGEHTLTVTLAPNTEPAHWTGKQEPEVVDAARGPVRIVVHGRPGRTDLRIAIVDARSGEALEPTSAKLGLFDAEHDQYVHDKRVQTGAGFVASAATPAGKWRLDVVTATGQRGSLAFELDAAQTAVELRLPLQQPGSLTGRVHFVGVAAPDLLVLRVDHAVVDRRSFQRYRFPGQWGPDVSSQTVEGAASGGTGALLMQPARNLSFRLDRVDPDQDLVLRGIGDGVYGEATVRVAPGGTGEVVLEVRAKPR